MKSSLACCLLSLATPLHAELAAPAAANPAAAMEAVEWRAEDGTLLRYRWHAPAEIEEGAKLPLVIFLHGAGERGSDNIAQLRHGVPDLLRASKALGEPCFLIAPQCPAELWWAPIDRRTMLLASAGGPNPLLDALLERVALLMDGHPVDPERLYVTGLSMGGFATWDLLARAPDRIAAAIPICGGGDPATVDRFRHVPLWVFHGTDDAVVPLRSSTAMTEALAAAGAEPKTTWYPGVGHDSWTATYADREVLRWLFDQRRATAETPETAAD